MMRRHIKQSNFALASMLLLLSATLFLFGAAIFASEKHWAFAFMFGSLATMEASLAFVFRRMARRVEESKADNF